MNKDFNKWWNNFKNILNNFDNQQFIFRGQANKKWPLKTSFQREKEKNKEYELVKAVKDFDRKHSYQFKDKKDIYEWLRYGQHYGLSTPYLDFSKLPYVSMFFACSSESDKDGNFFILNIDKFLEEFVIYFLNLEKVKSIINKSENFYVKEYIDDIKIINNLKEKLKNNKSIIKAFIESIEELEIGKKQRIKNEKHEIPKNIEISRLEKLTALKKDLYKELIKNGIVEDEIFFYPFIDKYNKRMVKQQGCFIYYNMKDSEKLEKFINDDKIQILNNISDTIKKDKILYEVIIPKQYKENILNKLKKMEISNYTLLMDKEEVSKDVKLELEYNLK